MLDSKQTFDEVIRERPRRATRDRILEPDLPAALRWPAHRSTFAEKLYEIREDRYDLQSSTRRRRATPWTSSGPQPAAPVHRRPRSGCSCATEPGWLFGRGAAMFRSRQTPGLT
jgi:hypothetical protein